MAKDQLFHQECKKLTKDFKEYLDKVDVKNLPRTHENETIRDTLQTIRFRIVELGGLFNVLNEMNWFMRRYDDKDLPKDYEKFPNYYESFTGEKPK